MPWRARYVAWGVGVVVFLLVLTVERRIGISLFWAIAWGLVATILITRIIMSKISHERPLGAVASMWVRELTAPRETTAGEGGAVSATRVRVTHRAAQAPSRTAAEAPASSRSSTTQATDETQGGWRCSDAEASARLSRTLRSRRHNRPPGGRGVPQPPQVNRGRHAAPEHDLPAPPAPRPVRQPASEATAAPAAAGAVPAGGGQQAQPTSPRGAVHSHVHPVDRRSEHRRTPAAQRPRRVRVVPARAAALVVPLRLAAPGPDRRHRRPVRRAARPLDAPARHDPAVPDPHVGRGARAQRGQPAAGHAGRAVLRRLPDRRAAAAAGPVDGGEGGLPRRPGADPQHGGPGRRAGRAAAAQDLPGGRGRRAGRDRLRGRAPRPGDRLRRASRAVR